MGLIAACARETLEESAWQFHPTDLVGVYQWKRSQGDITYLRFAFAGELLEHFPSLALDHGIVRTLWLSAEEVLASAPRHRSPLVVQCMQDHLRGQRWPLQAVYTDSSVWRSTP